MDDIRSGKVKLPGSENNNNEGDQMNKTPKRGFGPTK
jgi:hypothetical protein